MTIEFDIDAVFHGEKCRLLARSWDKWRRDKIVPSRDDMDLEDIKAILPNIAIGEIPSPKVARLRLVGTAASLESGTELTGVNWIDQAPEAERERLGSRIYAVATQPCASWTIGQNVLRSGTKLNLEYASFPILPINKDNPPQLIACFEPLEDYNRLEGVGTGLEQSLYQDFKYLDIGAGTPI